MCYRSILLVAEAASVGTTVALRAADHGTRDLSRPSCVDALVRHGQHGEVGLDGR